MALKQQSRNFLAQGTSLLAGLLLDSCFEAQFLTGHGCILAHDPGVGDPCSKGLDIVLDDISPNNLETYLLHYLPSGFLILKT